MGGPFKARSGAGVVVAVVCALLVVAPASARQSATAADQSFSGNVCSLLGGKQVAAVQIPTNCVEQKTVTNSQGTVYDAIWGNVKKFAPRLNVGIWKVANPVYFTILKGAHASGKSAGIGEWSRETGPVNGATGASIAFVVGGYFALIYVDTGPNKHLNGLGAFNAIAKTVAAKL